MFSQTFAFRLPARINFVGGGGKTSLILKLQEEYAESIPAIYTTTTRIHPPHPAEGLTVLSSNNEDLLRLMLRAARGCWFPGRRFVVTALSTAPNFLCGLSPGFGELLERPSFPLILNEADGSRSVSLKMPRSGEPVLMTDAEYLVPVIGLDCIGKPLGPETVFRWEIAARHFGNIAGVPIDPNLAASILMHPEGVCRDFRPGMQIIPFINKVDSDEDTDSAQALATALINNSHFPVTRVVLGSAENGTAHALQGEIVQ